MNESIYVCMKMTDVKVGMRLRSTVSMTAMDQFANVTELTERGFKYSLDAGYPMIPRWGMSVLKDGHEHFGLDGEAHFEPVETSPQYA